MLHAIFMSGLLALGCPPLHAGEFYRWQDEQGKAVYADHLPPDKVHEGHAVLDAQGRELRRLPPEPTAQEREAMRREQARREQEAQAAREQQARDAMLLDLYASEASLIEVRDARLASLDAQREALEQQLADQRAWLEMLETRHPGHEDIPLVRQRITEGEKEIERLRLERERIVESFARDLQRFRALKAGKAAVSP